jgi:hypothetical protein
MFSPTIQVGVGEVLERLGDHLVDGGSVRRTLIQVLDLTPRMFEAAQGGRICLRQDQAEDVDAATVQFSPQRFGEHHVERLGGAVGHHVGRTG